MKLINLTLILSAVFVSSAAATNINIEPSCDVNLNGNMQFQDDTVTILTDDGKEVVFTDGTAIIVDGNKLTLSNSEQRHANAYHSAIQDAVPLTFDIAVEGLELASETINEVFGGLLGLDDPLLEDFDDLFADLRNELNDHFYNDQGGFTLNGSDLEHKGWVSNAWDDKFSNRVEDMVAQSMGRLMLSLGSQLLFGGDDATSTIDNLENLDSTIEQRIEMNAQRIEEKAEQLCSLLREADIAEDSLSHSHKQLQGLNIISISNPNAL